MHDALRLRLFAAAPRKARGRIDATPTGPNDSSMATSTPVPRLVDRQEWQRLRQELLEREKAHMRAGDAVSAARRRLPMTAMEPVELVGANGRVSLHDVFEGRRMLLAYLFMWNRGAPHRRQSEGCTHVVCATTARSLDLRDQRPRYGVRPDLAAPARPDAVRAAGDLGGVAAGLSTDAGR